MPTASQILSWFRPNDYPAEEQKAGHEGRPVTLVRFDDAGNPDTCRVVTSSGWPTLDTYTCSLALARFRIPATKSDGPLRYMLLPVRWTSPR